MPGGRPSPLHGQAGEILVDIGAFRHRVDTNHNGLIDDDEARAAGPESIRHLFSLVSITVPLVATVEHVTSCLAGSQGMDSPRVIRGWNERRKRKTGENVVPFERRHDDGDEAA